MQSDLILPKIVNDTMRFRSLMRNLSLRSVLHKPVFGKFDTLLYLFPFETKSRWVSEKNSPPCIWQLAIQNPFLMREQSEYGTKHFNMVIKVERSRFSKLSQKPAVFFIGNQTKILRGKWPYFFSFSPHYSKNSS